MGKYLYCIIKEKQPKKFGVLGIEGRKVYTLHDGPMAVVVSDTPQKDGEYLITRDYTIAHHKVLEEVMRRGYDILPVSFGTVADNNSLLKEKLLRERREEFDKAFKYIEKKVELNLKVLWNDVSSVFQEIAAENKAVKWAKQIAQKRRLGRFGAANIGEVVKKELDAKRARIAEKILSQIRPFAADTREGNVLQDAMILNETFLVPKSSWKKYDSRILEFARAYGDKLNFINYGPVPPYNFVSIRVSFPRVNSNVPIR